jgi:hypothetical protein
MVRDKPHILVRESPSPICDTTSSSMRIFGKDQPFTSPNVDADIWTSVAQEVGLPIEIPTRGVDTSTCNFARLPDVRWDWT